MLPAEGNTDDRDAKQQAENQMCQRDPDAAAKDPDNIEDGREAAAGDAGRPVLNL